MADERITAPESDDFEGESDLSDKGGTNRSVIAGMDASREIDAKSAEKGDFQSESVDADDVVSIMTPDAAKSPNQALYDRLLEEMAVPKPGQALRQVREAAGLELDALAAALRIRLPYLMAIERMEVGIIPSGYVTPYLRAYAGRFDLDGDRIVTSYTEATGGVATVSGPIKVERIEEPQRSPWMVRAIAAGVGLALLGLAVLLMVTQAEGGDETRILAATGAVPMNGARESLFADDTLPERLDVSALPLTLTAVRDGWIEVRGADGTIFRSRVMRRGETYMPRVGADWTVSARDGGAFEWRLGDAVIRPLGPDATPVYAASVDVAAAEAAQAAAPSMAAAAGNGQPAR